MNMMQKVMQGEHVVFPMGWDDLGTRKTAFADVFLSLLKKRGYTNPRSLKVKGAYAFEVDTPEGGTTKIGLKSGFDGWLNTAHIMVEKVDTVWVMTFRWDSGLEEPVGVDVHEIPAKTLLDVYDCIHQTRKRIGRPAGEHTYIPVLNSTRDGFLKKFPDHYCCSEGALEDYATLIFNAPVRWSNKEPTGINPGTSAGAQKEIVVTADPLQGIEDPIAVLKQLIAKRNNTSVDKVKVLIEA